MCTFPHLKPQMPNTEPIFSCKSLFFLALPFAMVPSPMIHPIIHHYALIFKYRFLECISGICTLLLSAFSGHTLKPGVTQAQSPVHSAQPFSEIGIILTALVLKSPFFFPFT